MTISVPRSEGQLTESVERIGQAAPTYLRTYGLTKNLQDSGGNLASRNAQDNGDVFDSDVTTFRAAMSAVVDQFAEAYDRMPVVRSARPGILDPAVRKAVLLRDAYTCRWCGSNPRTLICAGFEVDHIVPWSAGGTNATDNLRTLCAECNQERSNYRTDIEAARARLIVGECVHCHGRRYVPARETDDGRAYYRVDHAAVAELGPEDWEVPVWCLNCRAPSATSRAHADDVRRRQSNRYTRPTPTADAQSRAGADWKD